MNISDIYWKEITNCIEYIDTEVYAGSAYKEIANGLDRMLNTRARVIRDAFNACMPYSLSRYIKRRMYTLIYMKWKENPIKLSSRSQFRGVKKFAPKFAREFGFEILEDVEEYELQPKLDTEEIRRLHKTLENAPVVKRYKLSDGDVNIETSSCEILKQMLRLKSYFLPECMADDFLNLSNDEKMLLLISIACGICAKEKRVVIPLSQLEVEMATSKFYDFKDYYLLGNGHMVFVPKLAARYYKDFLDCCEELLPDIKAVIPEGSIYGDLKKEVDAISEADTLEEISKAIGISDPRPLVWQYLKWGYLRLKDSFAIALYS